MTPQGAIPHEMRLLGDYLGLKGSGPEVLRGLVSVGHEESPDPMEYGLLSKKGLCVKSLTQVFLYLVKFLFAYLASSIAFSRYCQSTIVLAGASCQCHNTPDCQADNYY
jgi:hypothetical protein